MKSIVTEYTGICFYCHSPAQTDHHLLFGRGIRDLAEEDGLKVPICHLHHTLGRVNERIHDNPMAEKLSKMLGQAVWEKHYGTREDFMKRYGRNYL